MSADRRRIVSLAAALGATAALIVTTGCTPASELDVGPAPTVTSAPTIPADWPDGVPLYRGGRLSAAYVTDSGDIVAAWNVPGAKASDVAGEYGRLLTRSGYRRTDWFSRNGAVGFTYVGHGLVVEVATMEVDAETTLDVGVSRS